MVRGLSAGAFFRGCVDRSGRILSVDETATAAGRAGESLLGMIVSEEHPAVTGMLSDRSWRGLRALRVSVPGQLGPTVLVALAVRRLVDVALLMLHSKEDLLMARDFQQLFDTADQGVWAFGPDHTPLFTNARMAHLLHCGPQDLLLRAEEFMSIVDAGVALHRADGTRLSARTSTVPMNTAGNEEFGTLLLADDTEPPIEELRLARVRLHDPLTGLPNRLYLAQRLTGDGRDSGLAIVLCNLRGFAMFNHQYGTARGDQLLGAVADRLQRQLLPTQFLGRLNKDEFIIACPSLRSPDAAHELAGRLRKAFAALVTFDDTDYQARLSCGVAFRAPGQEVDFDELVKEASEAAH